MGRTIQGHTLPMLVEQPCAAPLDALAELARNGLLLIGPPNVGCNIFWPALPALGPCLSCEFGAT